MTKKVKELLQICEKKDKNNYYDYIDIFESNGISLSHIFKEKDIDYAFPWDNIIVAHNKESLFKYYLKHKRHNE